MTPPVGKSGPLIQRHSCARRQLVVVEQLDQRRAHLAEVVRRDVGGHADGDAGGAVDQQVRDARRQHDGLGLGAVEVRAHRHRVLIELDQQLIGEPRQPALGVAVGGGEIAVERSEVARAVDQRIAQRERLRHAHQRVVDRGVAVRMEVAEHVADHRRRLAVLGVGAQALLPHREQDAALHRLEAVAHVRERARGDDRQRVVQVARSRRVVQRDRVVATARSACSPPPAGGRAGGGGAAGRGLVDEVEERRIGGRWNFAHGTEPFGSAQRAPAAATPT